MTHSPAPLTILQNLAFADDSSTARPLYLDAHSAPSTRVTGRTVAHVSAGETLSLASYFNAFAAGYWAHWTVVREVTLEVATTGRGTITVMRSDAAGAASVVDSHPISGASTSHFELSLTGFESGGWYWFDVAADDDVEITAASWQTAQAPVTAGLLSIAVTTFNKPDYCVRTLEALAENHALLAAVDKIFIIDQGDKKVADEQAFPAVAAALGEHLEIIDQANLGGSGGFSRGMVETLKREDSAFVMLLDDDVEVEPEGILRAVQFARLCASPTIVGGHMLDLNNKTVLHAFSEIVDRNRFMWGSPDPSQERHDFAEESLRDTPWLHARQDGDYNGWWMCLIPTTVLRTVGLSLPLFIKWDDSEYGLRAADAGFPTVSLPGAALWHISWLDKDDSLDWQAYFHARNRLIAALLHSPAPRGGTLLSEYRKQDLKHLLSMQYYTVTLRHQAFRDVLDGPAGLHAAMPTKLGEVRRSAAAFAETKVYPHDEAPAANEGERSYPPDEKRGPRGRALLLFIGKETLRHWFTSPRQKDVDAPQVRLSKRDATWWRVPGFDSALVDTGDGTGSSWYTRDRARFRGLWRESMRLNRALEKNWDRLRDQYRAAAPEITSVDEWEKTFRR